MLIDDGTGTSKKAGVDTYNRLLTSSTARSTFQFASDTLNTAYDFSTGAFISLTSVDTESGVFYLKNTSTTKDLYIHTIRTCSEVGHKVTLYKNPTGGTLITNASAGVATNMNLGSSDEADATVYKGADGATITGGSIMTQHINDVGHSTGEFQGALILAPDTSIAISFEVPSAADACVRVTGHYA